MKQHIYYCELAILPNELLWPPAFGVVIVFTWLAVWWQTETSFISTLTGYHVFIGKIKDLKIKASIILILQSSPRELI